MKRETKIISILASAIFTLSLIIMAIPSAFNSSLSYSERWREYSDENYPNISVMRGFGSVTSSIRFEYAEGHEGLDKDTFEFLKNSYEKFKYLDILGSTTEPSSIGVHNIYDINKMPVGDKIEINYELFKIIDNSATLFDISNGIFDITSGKMFSEISSFIDGAATYDVAQYATGFNTDFEDRLLLEEIDSKYYATRTHEDTMLDLGGYLKGYFTEYVRGLAVQSFPDNDREIFVDSGGSSMTYIGEEDKDILIASPRGSYQCGWISVEGCPGKWIDQNNWHLSSSGDYVQYRMYNGERIHHLVDPRDGSFVQNRGLVSIMSQGHASYLDALSSIIFVADPSEYSNILSSFNEEIDIVYLETNTEQDDYSVNYLQAGSETKFIVSDIHLPREVE